MKINYFDAHSHPHDFKLKEEREKILKQMKNLGVFTIAIGTDKKESLEALNLAKNNENIFCSIGQHPVDNKTEIFDENFYQKILDENKNKAVCIGECGLDYYWPKKDLEIGKISEADFLEEKIRQKNLFEKQIDFSIKNNLPLMLHVRSFKNSDAHFDTFEILDKKQKKYNGKIRANFHFFTENKKIAEEVIKRGFFISFPGVITFADLDEVVKEVPIEKIFSETDSPYATPKPFRGQKNNPVFVKEVVKKIAEVKNLDFEECNKILIKNAVNFFNIK